MNLDNAPDRAASVKGPKAAARLYADIEYELAMGEPNVTQETAGENALQTLESRFPGVKQAANDIVENGHLPNMSRRAKQGLDRDQEPKPALHARTRDQHRREIRSQQAAGRRSLRQRASSASAIHARPPYGSRARRVARMRWQQTGVPDTAESVTQFVMTTLGTILGLTFLYTLVSPKGSRAVAIAGAGLEHGVQSLISPHVDPLRPSTSAVVSGSSRINQPAIAAASSDLAAAARRAPGSPVAAGVNHSVPGHAN